jgi:hypothetical protein
VVVEVGVDDGKIDEQKEMTTGHSGQYYRPSLLFRSWAVYRFLFGRMSCGGLRLDKEEKRE